MKTPARLENALLKLYTAFHEGTLHPECCKNCASGTVCDNNDSWKHLTENHGSLLLNYVGKVHQTLGRKFNGYSPRELLQIEAVFLKGCGYSLPLHYKGKRPTNPTAKEILFNGLCATVTYLCEIEGIKDVMDFTNMFSYVKPSIIQSVL